MNNVGRSFRYAVVVAISLLGALPLCAQDNIVPNPFCTGGNGQPVAVVNHGAGNSICTLVYTATPNAANAYNIEMDGICTLGEAIGARADSRVINCKNYYNITVSGTSSYKHVNFCGGHNLGVITATGYVSTLAGVTLTSSSSWEDCDYNINVGQPATLTGAC